MNKLTKPQLNTAIVDVAKLTGKTKEDITARLFKRDKWAWFLVRLSVKYAILNKV